MEREKITAFIVCMNEESNIERCLNSVKFCDEIVIVDSGSTDKTLEICQKFSARIVHHDWEGHSRQKKFALGLCTTPWVFNIDADEEVTDELAQQIIDAVENGPSSVKGYKVNRVVYHLGRWWRRGGWYPEYRLRLLRRADTDWGGSNLHEKALVDGPVGKLDGELLHYSFTSLENHISVINSYSSILADEMLSKKKQFPLTRMIFNSLGRFIKFYIVKKGFRDGIPGLIVAVSEAFYVFLKYAKLWELRSVKEMKHINAPSVESGSSD